MGLSCMGMLYGLYYRIYYFDVFLYLKIDGVALMVSSRKHDSNNGHKNRTWLATKRQVEMTQRLCYFHSREPCGSQRNLFSIFHLGDVF